MPTSVTELLRAAGDQWCGVVLWNTAPPADEPGIYLVTTDMDPVGLFNPWRTVWGRTVAPESRQKVGKKARKDANQLTMMNTENPSTTEVSGERR